MNTLRALILGVIACVLACAPAWADKLHLKDGRVLEGTVVREGDGWVQFKVKVGTVESVQLFTKDDIAKVERTEAPKDGTGGDKPDAEKPSSGSTGASASDSAASGADKPVVVRPGVARIAVLNFGPPSSWKGEVGSTVGGVIQARHWEQAIELLKKDKVSIVVVRVNSGGGSAEFLRFHTLYHEKYKPNFRTVAWIESAISAAAMSPWTIEEFYFLPGGNLGACTGWGGRLQAMKGAPLEIKLIEMEEAGKLGKRPSPYIMRAMQIQEPLSVDIDENGNVIWRQDENGQVVLNKANRVFTINAEDAVKYGFAKGIAADVDELARLLGVQEWEPAGKEASDFIDKMMRDSDKVEKRLGELVQKYQTEMQFAAAANDRTKRGEFLGRAKRWLAELRRYYKDNPMACEGIGLDDEWLKEQEQRIRDMSAQP